MRTATDRRPDSRSIDPNARLASVKSLSSGTGTQLRSAIPTSEVSAAGLVAFDCLEQRAEVALAETAGSSPLDDLEEHRRPVGDGFGEDLQQETLVVTIDEDVQSLQVVPRQGGVDALHGLGVVGVGHAHEAHAACPH